MILTVLLDALLKHPLPESLLGIHKHQLFEYLLKQYDLSLITHRSHLPTIEAAIRMMEMKTTTSTHSTIMFHHWASLISQPNPLSLLATLP